MNVRELRPPADLPAPSARIPAVAVRLAVTLLIVALTLVVFGASGWLAVGIILALLAGQMPETWTGWLAIVFLALGQLGRHATLSWRFLVLLAGLHLLHALTTLALELPWRSWVQPAVFLAPLRRFVAIQIPSQLLAVVALLLLAPNAHGHRPATLAGAALAGAAGLAALAFLLLHGGVSDREVTVGGDVTRP